jgi:GGDEF domain-containing protein
LISLGKFLRVPDESEAAQSVRALRLLVQGIEMHTPDFNLDCNGADHAQFRAGLAGIRRQLVPEITAPEALDLAGGAIQIIAEHNQLTAGKLRSQFQELRCIIATFIGAVAAMVSASDASLAQLAKIQAQVSAAEKIDDLRSLKAHLCDCLSGITSEVEAHHKNSASGMARLAEGARQFEISAGRAQPRTALDQVTGLPTRAEAVAALSKASAGDMPAVAVVFVIKRLKQTNSRFGRGAGDSLLSWLSTYLGSGANPEEGLFRWSGPALLAVIGRNVPLVRIRQDLAALIGDMPAREMAIGSRKVPVAVSVGWMVFPVTAQVSRLVGQVDAFVESQSAEDAYAIG